MKKFLLLFFIPLCLSAQVGINTDTPNPDAMLDIVSADSGLLIPRLDLVATTNPSPLSTDVAGMILYNEATVNDVTPGFYYNDGALWIKIGGATGADWTTSGNAGTNASANFLGTTDNVPLSLRVNNTEKVRLETNGTISTLNVGRGVYIGEGAGANDTFTHPDTDSMGNPITVDNNNSFVGYNAGNANTTGDRNNAFGFNSLVLNTTGTNNNAFGVQCLDDNTTGSHNTAFGNLALTSNTTGVRNQAFGNQALRYNTDGIRNIGIGYAAARENTSGSDNIAIGRYALGTNVGGSFNTVVGVDAYWINNFTSTTTYDNSTALGYGTTMNGSNRIRLGNGSITQIKGKVNFTIYSDARIKDNVTEDVVGLDFIKKLRPVTYNFNLDKQYAIEGVVDTSDYAKKYAIDDIKFSGFIAQEIEAAAKESNYNFSAVTAPETATDLYGVRYAEFVVPLVKAVQEQQDIIESQQKTIESLSNQIALINKKLNLE